MITQDQARAEFATAIARHVDDLDRESASHLADVVVVALDMGVGVLVWRDAGDVFRAAPHAEADPGVILERVDREW